MKTSLLDKVNFPEDFRCFTVEELGLLSKDIKEFFDYVPNFKKGHKEASLGVVELTVALHYFFNTPNDVLLWDVGHQAYTHKILTGRKKQLLNSNRMLNGISGFPLREESKYDLLSVGHSSTSISFALGMSVASKLNNIDREHIAVIGDSSISSGMAMEALNHAIDLGVNMTVILNDNQMGIDKTIGSLSRKFQNSNTCEAFSKLFEFNFIGPINGYDFKEMFIAFTKIKEQKGLKFVHVKTKKNISNPVIVKKTGVSYQEIFGKTLLELAEQNSEIVAISPAMISSSCLSLMKERFPDRTFDVGIAEQHAITFSAGLSAFGKLPFCVIYATFLQRAIDQVIHDVALQKLPIVLCVDRAGIVGEDGATHHGIFDVALLSAIPNVIIAIPRGAVEFRNLLYTSQFKKALWVIRYPKKEISYSDWVAPFKEIPLGKGELIKQGNEVAVLTIGTICEFVSRAINSIEKYKVAHYDMRFFKPIDEDLLDLVCKNHKLVITVEEGMLRNGLGSEVAVFMVKNEYNNVLKSIGLLDEFITHGKIEELYDFCGLSEGKLKKTIKQFCEMYLK